MKKIFICEDDPGILEVMETILVGEGYQVFCYSTGRNVEKEVNLKQPDLILLDLWMPELDGPALIKRLKEGLATRTIPVIIVSAASDIQKVADEQGVQNYLRKPFHIDELTGLVKQTLVAAAV